MKHTKNRSENFDFGLLGLLCVFCLLAALILTGGVPISFQHISLREIPDSVRASIGSSMVAIYVRAWESEEPLQFWVFVGVLLVAVSWLLRRSGWLLGVALVVAALILCLRLKT